MAERGINKIQEINDFIWSSLPLFQMDILRFGGMTTHHDTIFIGEYSYELMGCYKPNIIHISKYRTQGYEYDRYNRIEDLEVETCHITISNDEDVDYQFPLFIRKIPDIREGVDGKVYNIGNTTTTIFGNVALTNYDKHIYKANHCVVCNKTFTNINAHYNTKKHLKSMLEG